MFSKVTNLIDGAAWEKSQQTYPQVIHSSFSACFVSVCVNGSGNLASSASVGRSGGERLSWQGDFFDRRLRRGESHHQKWLYLWQNPVMSWSEVRGSTGRPAVGFVSKSAHAGAVMGLGRLGGPTRAQSGLNIASNEARPQTTNLGVAALRPHGRGACLP